MEKSLRSHYDSCLDAVHADVMPAEDILLQHLRQSDIDSFNWFITVSYTEPEQHPKAFSNLL